MWLGYRQLSQKGIHRILLLMSCLLYFKLTCVMLLHASLHHRWCSRSFDWSRNLQMKKLRRLINNSGSSDCIPWTRWTATKLGGSTIPILRFFIFKNAGVLWESNSQYVGGIATVMSGTSSVESDFLLINWTKDSNSRSLTDFSLEAILHCKQYGKLEKHFNQ